MQPPASLAPNRARNPAIKTNKNRFVALSPKVKSSEDEKVQGKDVNSIIQSNILDMRYNKIEIENSKGIKENAVFKIQAKKAD